LGEGLQGGRRIFFDRRKKLTRDGYGAERIDTRPRGG